MALSQETVADLKRDLILARTELRRYERSMWNTDENLDAAVKSNANPATLERLVREKRQRVAKVNSQTAFIAELDEKARKSWTG